MAGTVLLSLLSPHAFYFPCTLFAYRNGNNIQDSGEAAILCDIVLRLLQMMVRWIKKSLKKWLRLEAKSKRVR
jgi:hypothetical protein